MLMNEPSAPLCQDLQAPGRVVVVSRWAVGGFVGRGQRGEL